MDDEQGTREKSKKKKKKGDEVIEKTAPRDWESNLQNEKSAILNKRQKELQGSTKG